MKKARILLTLLFAFFLFDLKIKAITNITINDYSLIPEFDVNTKIYNVYVSEDTEIIGINVMKSDNEIITGSGSKSLKKGLNIIEIKSYINDELISEYTLNIIRGELKTDKKSSTLKSLKIKNYSIDFDSDIFEYTINALEQDDYINVSYITNNPLATVKLTGDTYLTKKENIIKIEVTSEDKKNKSTYVLNVIKNIKDNEITAIKKSVFDNKKFDEFDLKLIRIGLYTIGVIIFFVLFYLIFIKKRTNKVLYISRNILRK